jgi:hypothetical protein
VGAGEVEGEGVGAGEVEGAGAGAVEGADEVEGAGAGAVEGEDQTEGWASAGRSPRRSHRSSGLWSWASPNPSSSWSRPARACRGSEQAILHLAAQPRRGADHT